MVVRQRRPGLQTSRETHHKGIMRGWRGLFDRARAASRPTAHLRRGNKEIDG